MRLATGRWSLREVPGISATSAIIRSRTLGRFSMATTCSTILARGHRQSANSVGPGTYRDGKLGQIAQFQKIPLGRETCTELPFYGLGEIAVGLGCETFSVAGDHALKDTLEQALEVTRKQRRPVVVDLSLDASEKTWFTRGVVKTNFFRLPPRDRTRMLGRALLRRLRR